MGVATVPSAQKVALVAKHRTLHITVSDEKEVVKEFATELPDNVHPAPFHVGWAQSGHVIEVTVRDEDDGTVG